MYDENFLKIYDSEKIKSWNNNYIDYIIFINQITSIKEKCNNPNNDIGINEEEKNEDEENENNEENQIELNNPKINLVEHNFKEEDKEKINNNLENIIDIDNIDNINKIDNNLIDKSKNNNISKSKKVEKDLKRQIKDFISALDKEIKKIHIFYTNKETLLFEGINTQISIFNDFDNNQNNNNDKKVEIISELNYLSKLAKSLINYAYLNIKTLKEILDTFDREIMNISYKYIKKHLSKTNGDLVYILNFKILDECIIAIQELLELIKNNLNKSNYFQNNKIKEEEFNNNNEEIIDNIQEIEEIHEQIFEEFIKWEKYLNMSLELPSSSNNSIFKNTSYIGDSIPLQSEKGDNRLKLTKIIKINNINNNLLETNNNENLIKLEVEEKDNNNKINDNLNENNDNENKKLFSKNIDENDINIENESFGSSQLFANFDIFSYDTKKILTKECIRNLYLLFTLMFFYSFSISYLIPNTIIFLYQENNNYEYIYLYGIVISIPAIGNITAKILLQYFFNKAFKIILVLSLLFLLSYYSLLISGIFFNQILLIIIGRFLLGFSILSHLSKIYADYYIPITTQIKSNQRHNFYINIGYFFGFLLNSLYILDIKEILKFNFINFEFNIFKIIIILCLLFSLAMFIIIIIHFNDPTKYPTLRETLLKMNEKHRLSKDFLVENKEKKKTDILDKNYSDANDASFSSQASKLSSFVKSHLNKKYYSKIKIILIFFLISIEYTRENLIIFIPRLISYKTNSEYNNYILIFGPIIISFSFLISYLLQNINLTNKKIQKKRIKILIIILLFLFFLNIFFYYIIFPIKDINDLNNILYLIIFPTIGIICMIILNELFYIIIINLFIKLLPSEKIKFCCFKLSFVINFTTKIIRIIPSLIIVIFYFYDENKFKKYFSLIDDDKNYFNYCNIILFGIQAFNQFFSIILCLFNSSSLKHSSRNRLLYQS